MSQTREEFIEEAVEAFKANISHCYDVARSPEDIKWAIFSTGDKEIEEKVLDQLVANFLTNIEGVFVYRVTEPEELISNLQDAIGHIQKELFIQTSAAENDYVLKTGK